MNASRPLSHHKPMVDHGNEGGLVEDCLRLPLPPGSRCIGSGLSTWLGFSYGGDDLAAVVAT